MCERSFLTLWVSKVAEVTFSHRESIFFSPMTAVCNSALYVCFSLQDDYSALYWEVEATPRESAVLPYQLSWGICCHRRAFEMNTGRSKHYDFAQHSPWECLTIILKDTVYLNLRNVHSNKGCSSACNCGLEDWMHGFQASAKCIEVNCGCWGYEDSTLFCQKPYCFFLIKH